MPKFWLTYPFMAPAEAPGGGGGGGEPSPEERGDFYDPGAEAAPAPAEPQPRPADAPASPVPLPREKAPSPNEPAGTPDGDGEGDNKTEAPAEQGPAVEGAPAPGEEQSKRDARLPLSRHKEILNAERQRREAAERRLAELQQQNQPDLQAAQAADDAKVAELETAVAELIADGKTKDAAAKQAELRALERSIQRRVVDAEVQRATVAAVEAIQYNAKLTELEGKYPQIDMDSPDYDQSLALDVIDLMTAYRNRGMGRAAALESAVSRLIHATASNTPPAPTSTQSPADAVRAQRREAATTATLAATRQQPPRLTAAGTDSDRHGGVLSAESVLKMSDAEFAKLDDKALAVLRGDSF